MKLQFTETEVKHLRLVLGWMRVEYCLDEDMQRGSLQAIKSLMDAGVMSQEDADHAVARRADQIKQVPKYVRHGIKMLTKSVREHDGVKGDVVDAEARTVQLITATHHEG